MASICLAAQAACTAALLFQQRGYLAKGCIQQWCLGRMLPRAWRVQALKHSVMCLCGGAAGFPGDLTDTAGTPAHSELPG
jgi:hypothetical protein